MTDPFEVARFVNKGSDPPEWLRAASAIARDALAWTAQSDADFLPREKLREQLRALEAAAEFVRANLCDINVSTLLLNGDTHFLNQNEMYHGLGDVARRAARTLDLVPVGPGRNKFFGPSAGLAPRVVCALMISIIWRRVHGAPPPVTNKQAQEACEALWTEAGGSNSGKWAALDRKSVSTWREHLIGAKEAENSSEARHVTRLLFSTWGENLPTEPISPLETGRQKSD